MTDARSPNEIPPIRVARTARRPLGESRKGLAAAVVAAVVFAATTGIAVGAPRATAVGDSIQVNCRVFLDQNADGARQVGEPGLPGVRLTNGVQVVATDAAGERTIWVDRNVYRFATLTIPAGYWPTTPWFLHVPVGTSGPAVVDFGLRLRPETATDPVRWVHIADTQVMGPGDQPWNFATDMATIDQLADPPLFLINAGDLVEVGSNVTHWETYIDQLSHPNLIVFPVVGNHDVLGVTPPLKNYEFYVGPPYYEFEAGSWVFIVYNSENETIGTPLQDAWLDALVEVLPPGKHLAIFQHRMLSERSSSIASHWAASGIVAAFSGHWHSLQFTRHKSGILDFNVSRSAAGPLDRTPRGFGLVTCLANGEVDYELRRFAVDHRAEITRPAATQTLAGDPLEVFVQAYDSTSPVTSLLASVSGPGGAAPASSLAREGISLWRGEIDLSALPEGNYVLTVAGSYEDGQSILLTRSFVRNDIVPIQRFTGESWPMFRRTAAGSSFVATGLQLPLDLAWATPVPGMVALSSPVVDAGRVFLGCRTETGDMADSGVLCCDAVSGTPQWFTSLPSGVALAPAVAGDILLVSTMADSVFGLDVETGTRVWAIAAPGTEYRLTAPIVLGAEALVGSEPRALKILTESGAHLWTSGYLGPGWHPYIYSAPAVGPNYAYFGFYGDAGTSPDGFSIVDRNTGAVVHQENGVYRSPIWAGDKVFVVGGLRAYQQALTARDPSGNVLWQSSKIVNNGTGPPALANGVLVVASEWTIDGFRASDGVPLWSRTQGWELLDMYPNRRHQKHSSCAPAIAGNTVFVGSNDGHLYALDLATGAELWKWYLGTPIASSPAVSGNLLFVGASDGHLYAFAGIAPGAIDASPGTGRPVLEFAMLPPRPNPSRSSTALEWVQPRAGRVRVEIFDVRGRRVRAILDDRREPGAQQVNWDGRDDNGRSARPGVYFARIRTGADSGSRKLVILGR